MNEITKSKEELFEELKELKKDFEILRENELKFRELADFLPQIIFEADINGKITYVNKQAYKTLGYPEDYPLIGSNTLDFFPLMMSTGQ